MKRIMSRYGSSEDEIDRMLRAGRFVDLLGVVRQGLRASVESYSIKSLEAHVGFERTGDIRAAGPAVRAVQVALGRGEVEALGAKVRADVETYNRDDCASALALRGWLEGLRAGLERGGTAVASGGGVAGADEGAGGAAGAGARGGRRAGGWRAG